MIQTLADTVLSVLFPQECRACGGQVESSRDDNCCRACWDKTKIFSGEEMLCNKCGAFLSDAAAPVAVLCHRCDEHKYDKAFAVGVYEKGLSAAVLALKNEPSLSPRIRSLIAQAALRVEGVPDLIVPIPLSKMRELERGYNQAAILGKVLSLALHVPVDNGSLARTSHTPIHRIGMDQRARELTVQKAFQILRPKFIEAKSVMLVDDVLTSGSTASACAAVLKKNGACRVDVFTLARAVMH